MTWKEPLLCAVRVATTWFKACRDETLRFGHVIGQIFDVPNSVNLFLAILMVGLGWCPVSGFLLPLVAGLLRVLPSVVACCGEFFH